MKLSIAVDDYCALAEFRYQIRKFLIISEKIARSSGLQPQQYMGLLALRGLPSDSEPSIRVLAERMQIRHNSAVELVNRLAKRGLVRRYRSKSDLRKVIIRPTATGKALLERVVRRRFAELDASQPILVRALNRVLTSAKSRRG